MLLLKLDAPTEPFWLEFPQHEVRVQVRPLSLAIIAAIDSYARGQVAEAARDRLDRIASGAPTNDLPDWDDADVRAGYTRELTLIGLARFGIVAWEGVGDAGGNPVPVTRATATAFARQLGDAFALEYERQLAALDAEGNASGAARRGASAPKPDTATPASPVH